MNTLTVLTFALALVFIAAATTTPAISRSAQKPTLATRIAEQQTSVWNCQDQLGQPRTPVSVPPWQLPRSRAYRRWTLNLWAQRRKACLLNLHLVAAVNRNLYRLAVCETGGKPGQNGIPDWDHRARSEHPGHWYEGSLGFLDSSWDSYKPDGYPAGAHQATPGQQMAVGRVLVERFGGYSSWPSCSRRLGLR